MSIEDYLTTHFQENEEIANLLRRHPIVMAPALIGATLMLLADFFFLPWLFRQDWWGPSVFLVALVLAALMAFRTVYIWRLNVLAITSKRIIEVEQRGFFERNVAEATYDKIQDVRYTIKGVWATIFSFGTVIVQTAGATINIDFDGLHHPVQAQRLIMSQQQLTTGRKTAEQQNSSVLDLTRANKASD